MASIGNALVGRILGHSAAEKAFRPWWDNFEDFLVYGLVMLGKTFFTNLGILASYRSIISEICNLNVNQNFIEFPQELW